MYRKGVRVLFVAFLAHPIGKEQLQLKFMMSKTTNGPMLNKTVFLKTISVRLK